MKLHDRMRLPLDTWRRDRVMPENDWYPVYPLFGESPAWPAQVADLDRLCAAWPDGEFLRHLVSLYGMNQYEHNACRRAIDAGELDGERSRYGYVTDHDALIGWLADRRARDRRGGPAAEAPQHVAAARS